MPSIYYWPLSAGNRASNLSKEMRMNKMNLRKIAVSLGLSALMVVGFVFATSAAGLNSNEQKIMDKLSQTVTVDGKTAQIPTEYVNQARNYLTSTADITDEQYTEIVKNIDAAFALVKEQKTVDISKFPASVNAQLLDYVKKAAAVVDLTVSYDGKDVTITDAENKTVFEGKPAIKVTGVDMTPVFVLGGAAVILLGASVLVSKKMKLFSK